MGCIPNRKKELKIKNSTIDKIKFTTKSTYQNLSPQKNNHQIENKKDSFKEIKIERGLFVQEFSVNPLEKYEIISILGEGSYGKVFNVKVKDSNIYRAMKVIKKNRQYNKEEEEKILNEIQILKKLDHPNILKVFEFYNTKSYFYIISELCTGGELFDFIIKQKSFSEKFAANIMKQILSAVQFCHKNQILHRDLKPENILLETKAENSIENGKFQIECDQENENNLISIKVIDFGTAEIFRINTLLSKQIGTPFYIAPEVLNNKYNEKCDLWACGVILFILLSGSPPFYGKNDKEIFEIVKEGKFAFKQKIWSSISQSVKNLIKSLLEVDFEKRLTAEEALKHHWFSQTIENLNFHHKKNIYNENSKSNKNTFETENDSQILIDKSKMIIEKKQSLTNFNEFLMNLKNFRAERKLQQATLYFMVHQLLSSQDVKEIREIFQRLDENQDGRLTKEEIIEGFKTLKYCFCSEEEIERIMDLVDIDKNGYIEYQEFISATIPKKKILTEENLKHAFEMFDKDKSGKISAYELKLVFRNSNEENRDVWEKIIKDIDLDGDGEISFFEFKEMMYNLISSA